MEPASILKAIKHCLPKESGSPISLHQPSFCGKEWEYVKECLDTGWVSSVGKYVDEFEKAIELVNNSLCLPSSTNLTDDHLNHLLSQLNG